MNVCSLLLQNILYDYLKTIKVKWQDHRKTEQYVNLQK